MNAELFERLFLVRFIKWLVETHSQDSSRDLVVWTESPCNVHIDSKTFLAVKQCDVSGMLGEHTLLLLSYKMHYRTVQSSSH